MKKMIFVAGCVLTLLLSACGSATATKTGATVTQAKAGAATMQAKSEFKPLEVKESGWIVRNGYLFCYVEMYNPNEDIAVRFPSVRVTARGENNEILGTQDQTMMIINPKESFVYGGQMFSVSSNPKTVEVQPLEPKDYNKKDAGDFEEYKPLEPVDCSFVKDKISGEINNPNDYSVDSAIVVGLCMNDKGELANIYSTFIHNVSANGKTPFEISMFGNKGKYSEIKVYAGRW